MKRTLSTLCLAASLTACHGEPIQVGAPQPPREYLTCADAPPVPDLEPLAAIALPNGMKAYDKGQTDTRDSVIARYILDLRAARFDCANQLGRVRDYVEGVE